MNKLTIITALVTGLLLLLVPRYILPACEYLGHPAMHCSDTARAEFVVGALFLVLGGATAFLRSWIAYVICAAGSIVLSITAFVLPDKFGYCHSSQMPCNYGMVPGVRFIAVLSAIIMSIALIRLVTSYRKKGKA
jgi:hypothetical protein